MCCNIIIFLWTCAIGNSLWKKWNAEKLFGINEMLLMLMHDGTWDRTDGGGVTDAEHVRRTNEGPKTIICPVNKHEIKTICSLSYSICASIQDFFVSLLVLERLRVFWGFLFGCDCLFIINGQKLNVSCRFLPTWNTKEDSLNMQNNMWIGFESNMYSCSSTSTLVMGSIPRVCMNWIPLFWICQVKRICFIKHLNSVIIYSL